MKRLLMFFWLAMLPGLASANCLVFAAGWENEIAKAINIKVHELEKIRPSPKAKPTLFIRLVDQLDPTDTSSLTTGTNSDRDELAKAGCLKTDKVVRNIMLATQSGGMSLAFVTDQTDALAQTVLNRINRIGYGSMAPETANDLDARDINYVIVIGGRVKAVEFSCTFYFTIDVDIDIHSIATRQFVPLSVKQALLAPFPDWYSTTFPDWYSRKYIELSKLSYDMILIKSKSIAPVCLGEVKVVAIDELDPYGDRFVWREDVGCIPPGGQKTLQAPTANVLRMPIVHSNGQCKTTWALYGIKLNEIE